jgi:hypothetical protein
MRGARLFRFFDNNFPIEFSRNLSLAPDFATLWLTGMTFVNPQ